MKCGRLILTVERTNIHDETNKMYWGKENITLHTGH